MIVHIFTAEYLLICTVEKKEKNTKDCIASTGPTNSVEDSSSTDYRKANSIQVCNKVPEM